MEIIMTKLSAKQRLINFLSKKDGYNTLSTAQARARFGIQNVSARIDELRQEGHVIYTNTKTRADGSKSWHAYQSYGSRRHQSRLQLQRLIDCLTGRPPRGGSPFFYFWRDNGNFN